MNIVFLTDRYYPNTSANSNCMSNIIDEIKLNHNVFVICFGDEESTKSMSYNGHNIIQVKSVSLKYKLNSKKKIASSVSYQFARIIRIIKILFSEATIRKQIVERYIKALKKIDFNIDLLIPICNPIESVIASMEFVKQGKNKNIILAPYLFDKFSSNRGKHYINLNYLIKKNKHLRIEKNFIIRSNFLIVNKSWAEHINNYFPEFSSKILEVEHPLFKNYTDSNISNTFLNNDIKIVYAGVLNKRIRPPHYVLSVIEEVIKINPLVHLLFYIRGDCDTVVNKSALKYKNNIFNYGYVKKEFLINALYNSSHLLLIGNKDVSQIPSKVFEYMSYGIPIIFFYSDPNDPIIRILDKYPLKCILSQRRSERKNNIVKTAFFLKNSINIREDYKYLESIFYYATPKYVANKILNRINE